MPSSSHGRFHLIPTIHSKGDTMSWISQVKMLRPSDTKSFSQATQLPKGRQEFVPSQYGTPEFLFSWRRKGSEEGKPKACLRKSGESGVSGAENSAGDPWEVRSVLSI